ncbi:MAG TPA: hypothetical protein VLA88_01780 [Candidatus Saccharimonadales bacterium]|nr:hypothetical protein [Candidatus Saccharimonadales bacterium]
MQEGIEFVRGFGAALQLLTLFMLGMTAHGHRTWARNPNGADASPRYAHITWQLNAVLAVLFVGFMIYVILGGRDAAFICVMAAAVILSCLHMAFLCYERGHKPFVGIMIGVALSFFGYGGMLIGGPLWVQTLAAVLMVLGILGGLMSLLMLDPKQETARAT